MVLKYLLRRLLEVLPVLFGMSVVVFLLVHLIPGDPVSVMLGDDYSEQHAAELRASLGLDRPLPVQYAVWLGRVAAGDLGQSLFLKKPVLGVLLLRGKTTLLLALGTLLVSLLVAIPFGVLSATRKDTWLDNLSRLVTMVGISMPVFWLGLLMMMLLSLKLRLLPPGGGPAEYGWKAFVMPALTLGLTNAALITRMTRSAMLDVLQQDYIRTARAKGLPDRIVQYRHALRNAVIPVITVVGLQFGFLLSGTVLTEYIFAMPGLGTLIVESIARRDFPLIQGAVLLTGLVFVLTNLVVDLLYGLMDPRIRF